MNSIDTSVLLYAINRDCPEHGAAIGLVRRALAEPSSWIVADQVWFELYRLLRNPSVLSAPLSAADAAETIEWYRARRLLGSPYLRRRVGSNAQGPRGENSLHPQQP